jgi:flagellar hook-length control protein FliK
MVPLRSSEVPAFTELLTGQDGAPPPEPDVEGGVPSQPDETNSVRAEGLSVTIRLPVRDGKPVAFVKELGNVETDAAAAEGASTPESVPARAVLTRSPTEVARLKIATIETRQEAPQGGDDLARGSSDRSFPEGMVPQQDVRTRQLTSTTAQDVPRSSSAAEARISQAVIDQTVKGVLLSVRNGSSELRVWLKPDHLGELQMRLVFKDNVLNVDVSTQNTAVKNVIEGNLNQLREMLDRNGVDVGRLSVTVDPELSSGGHFNRSPYAFQPVEGEWTRTYRGHTNDEQGSLDGWFRRAPVGRGANLIDVIA